MPTNNNEFYFAVMVEWQYKKINNELPVINIQFSNNYLKLHGIAMRRKHS